jgi:hypothetical protein
VSQAAVAPSTPSSQATLEWTCWKISTHYRSCSFLLPRLRPRTGVSILWRISATMNSRIIFPHTASVENCVNSCCLVYSNDYYQAILEKGIKRSYISQGQCKSNFFLYICFSFFICLFYPPRPYRSIVFYFLNLLHERRSCSL